MGYLDVDEMKRSMTQRAYLGWQMYWDQEPWGPWRDNMHSAIIAREVRRTITRSRARIGIEQFLVRDPNERRKESEKNFFGLLQTVATPTTPAEATKLRLERKRKRKDRRNDRPRKTSRKA